MKCMSCETHIPSEWQAAISKNTCPKCGDEIMSSHVKIVADNLKIVVSDLRALGEEQMDLLLDTFGLTRKGASPLQHPAANAELPQGFKQPNNPMYEFLKRSKAPHLANRQEQLKDIVNRVNSSGEEEIPPEAWDDFEAEPAVTAKQFLAEQGGYQPSPEEIRQLSQELGNAEEPLESDLHPALQKDRMRRLQASRDMAGGGGQGLFKRSG